MYKTKDMHLAAYLSLNNPIIKTEKINDIYFYFENVDDNMVLKYYNNDLVPVSSFITALKNIKRIINYGK